MAIIAIALLIAALFLILRSRRNRELGGSPPGEIIYSDTLAEKSPVIVSNRYKLIGKPDSLTRDPQGSIIPLERKSGRAPARPYDGDIAQATAYCMLVEEHYGFKPPSMRIQYADRHFDVPYTPERKQWVLRVCEAIRQARTKADIPRSHSAPAKCRRCSQRENCHQALS